MWLQLRFHTSPAGDLVPVATGPARRSRPYATDGARAVASLLAAARRARARTDGSAAAADACRAERDAALAECDTMVTSANKVYELLDTMERDVQHLEVCVDRTLVWHDSKFGSTSAVR